MFKFKDNSAPYWTDYVPSGDPSSGSTVFYKPGTYVIQVLAEDQDKMQSGKTYNIIEITNNHQPNKPTISGPTNGKKGVNYEYTLVSADPDGDDISYYVDWGDNTNSGWLGPYKSGETCKVSHTWTKRGTYAVKAKAWDKVDDEDSGWSDPLSVTMPKNKVINSRFYKIFEKNPIFLKLLQFLKLY